MDVSVETQEMIISALMKNSYLFTMCKSELNDGYFSHPSAKVIYKALTVYYNKYSALPSLNELLITIDDCYYPEVGVNDFEIKDTCCRLYHLPEPDEAFVRDKITDFIRKVRSSTALKKFVDRVKTNPNLESDSVVSDLAKALDVQLSTTKLFNISDMSQIEDARLSAVGSSDSSKIVKSFFGSINRCLMFGGWQPSTVNMVVAPPGCGKSMYLINEGAYAAKQGFDVLHIFIGDMVNYDGFIRYLSCVSGTPQNTLVMMPIDKQYEIVKLCNQQFNDIFNHIDILSYPSLALNVESLMEDVNKFEKQTGRDFGVIVIDYPDNLIQDGINLYTDGGNLYSSLERMARLTKAVVLTASQPSKNYWNHNIIPLEGAAESSKKQQCVDVMLTMNTETRGANFGTMLLAKARKGEVGKIFRFKTDFARCHLEEIDEATFNAMKATIKVR